MTSHPALSPPAPHGSWVIRDDRGNVVRGNDIAPLVFASEAETKKWMEVNNGLAKV